MKMKKLFLFLLLMTGISASAYDYPYLVFKTTGGDAQSVSVESLTLTISNGKLVATNASGTVELTLSDLSTMYFSETSEGTNGIQQLETTSGQVQVYTLTGMSVGTFESVNQARSALKNGVYVVKSNGKSYKFNLKK